MARPKTVSADPAWIQKRNHEDRHRDKNQVSIRIPPDTRERWRAAASAEGRTLKDWTIYHLDQAANQAVLGREQGAE